MNRTDQLVEQHIREYESRLKHMDELLERAHEQVSEPESHPELSELREKREVLAGQIEELKSGEAEHLQEQEIGKAGPMGVWDVIAQKLEKLVERLER